jgi:hypothetical protein
MAEWRRCPGCGFGKFGVCPVCYPVAAEQERQAEAARFREELADQERRAAGMLFCPDHKRHDGCVVFRRPEPAKRALTWQEAWADLRRRYVPPS